MNVRRLRCYLIAVMLLAGISPASAQEAPPSTSGPVTVTTLPHPPAEAAGQAGTPALGIPVLPPPCAGCDGTGTRLSLFDIQGNLTPGWVVAVEMDLVKPHITGFLNNLVNVGNQFIDNVGLPSPYYRWTAAPRVELGYRFSDRDGELLISYRFLGDDGWAALCGLPTGQANLGGTLDLNSIDLDYARHEHVFGPSWDVKWRAGMRLAVSHFDYQASNPFELQQASDDFVGAGPHAGLDVRWWTGWQRLFLYGRLEGAALWGRLHQDFNETIGIPGQMPFGGADGTNHTQGLPVLCVQAGLGWVPFKQWPFRLDAGYQYEVWWNIARAGDSTGNLYDQGAFLRAEWNY
jgi:hypothetical protein